MKYYLSNSNACNCVVLIKVVFLSGRKKRAVRQIKIDKIKSNKIMLIFQKIKSNHDSMIFKKIIGKSNQRVHRQNHRSLPVSGSCGHLWLKLYAWTQNSLFHQKWSIMFFTIFGGNTNTHKQQNLKITIVLGVSMLVQGSYAWILSSYVVEILSLDKDKNAMWTKTLQ